MLSCDKNEERLARNRESKAPFFVGEEFNVSPWPLGVADRDLVKYIADDDLEQKKKASQISFSAVANPDVLQAARARH